MWSGFRSGDWLTRMRVRHRIGTHMPKTRSADICCSSARMHTLTTQRHEAGDW